MSLAGARLSAARGAIARACLDALPPASLGAITLRPEQRRIVARAERALRQHGGCLIGEDVGRGKTFISLALARRWKAPMVVGPAALRPTWKAAEGKAGVTCQFISHEALSRRRCPEADFDALIVDESHHFRNPATARYEELARLAAGVPIVLLSATPLQNRMRDLAAQVALYWGERAFALATEQLSRFVIRGEDVERGDMPTVSVPEWLHVDADDGDVLAQLLDLPPPPRPLDGGDAGALRTIALVRAWASSRAALKGVLRSRRRLSTAIAQGVEAGRTPSRRETREWRAEDDVVQLGLAPLLMQQCVATDQLADIRRQLELDDAAHEALSAALRATDDPDRARVACLRALREANATSRIIAFSEYGSTVRAYFAAMRLDPGVGLLTARGACIATGALPRQELLSRFAPRAQGARERAAHDAVTLLLATDLLSEGMNLQDASIVVHLDLPWNPARLSQRVGRVRRPGGAGVVRSFLVAPPAGAEVLLAADVRLRRKLDQAQRVVGPSFAVLPSPTCPLSVAAPSLALDSAMAEGRFVGVLELWAAEPAETPSQSTAEPGAVEGHRPATAAVVHSTPGWLAALHDGRLIGSLRGTPTEAVEHLLTLAEIAGGVARIEGGDELNDALASLHRWIATEAILADCGVGSDDGPLHRRANALLGHIVGSAPRHEQALLLALAGRIRDHLAAPMPLGAEREVVRALEAATESRAAVNALTRATRNLDDAVRSRVPHAGAARDARLVAMIVVGPEDGQGGATRRPPLA